MQRAIGIFARLRRAAASPPFQKGFAFLKKKGTRFARRLLMLEKPRAFGP
jgi:hypothetical protein